MYFNFSKTFRFLLNKTSYLFLFKEEIPYSKLEFFYLSDVCTFTFLVPSSDLLSDAARFVNNFFLFQDIISFFILSLFLSNIISFYPWNSGK